MRHYAVTINIGGIPLRVEDKNNLLVSFVKDRYKNFLASSPSESHIRIIVSHNKLSSSGEEISLHKRNGIFYLQGERFKGVFYRNRNVAKVTMDYEQMVFDVFLRVFYSLILAINRGILVHSLGILKESKGYLFVGPSSSGKTTMARRIKNASILSDELVIVRRLKDRFFLFSTPFGGELQSEINYSFAPLEGIFFLDKSISGCKKEESINALVMFLRSIFFFLKDKKYIESVVEFSKELIYKFSPMRINILSNCEVINGFI